MADFVAVQTTEIVAMTSHPIDGTNMSIPFAKCIAAPSTNVRLSSDTATSEETAAVQFYNASYDPPGKTRRVRRATRFIYVQLLFCHPFDYFSDLR